MKKRKSMLIIIAVVLVLLVSACTTKETAIDDDGAKGFLWKIENNGNVVYLLGSIFVAQERLYPLSTKIEDAYKKSDNLYLDVNIQDKSSINAYMQQKAMYLDGSTLEDKVSPELYNQLDKKLMQYQQNANSFNAFKPWFIVQNLELLKWMEFIDDPKLQLNYYMVNKAEGDKKSIIGLLESTYQVDLLDSLSLEEQIDYLTMTLEENKENIGENAIDTWINGDSEGYKNLVLNSQYNDEDIFNKIVNVQATSMANKIKEIIEGENTSTNFVIIDANLLLANNGIINLLKHEGYDMTYLSTEK